MDVIINNVISKSQTPFSYKITLFDDIKSIALQYAIYYQISIEQLILTLVSEKYQNKDPSNLSEYLDFLHQIRFIPIPYEIYTHINGKDEENILNFLNSLILELGRDRSLDIMMWYFLLFPNQTQTLSIINSLSRQLQLPDYIDLLTLKNAMEKQYREMQQRIREELDEWKEIDKIHQQLENIPSQQLILNSEIIKKETFYIGDIVVDRTFPFIPNITPNQREKLKNIQPEDGLDFFNQCKAHIDCPMIIYNDGLKNYYKIYQGRYDKVIDNYDVLLSTTFTQENANSLIMKVVNWDEDRSKISENNIALVFIDFQNHSISFPIKGGMTLEHMMNIIHQTINPFSSNILLNYQFVNILPKKSMGEVYFYRLDIDNISFFDQLFNNPLFYHYIISDESLTPNVNKRKLNLRFFVPSLTMDDLFKRKKFIILGSYKMEIVEPLTTITYYNPIDQKITQTSFPDQVKAVKINFEQSTQLYIEYCVMILSRLLSIYSFQRNRILQLYQRVIPFLQQEEELVVLKKQKESRLQKLQHALPGFFLHKFSRGCPPIQQPIIIDKKDINQWLNLNQRNREEHILSLEYGGEEYFFGCNDELFQYPRLKKGRPCCYRTLATNVERKITGKIKNLLFLESEKLGELPEDIDNILKYVSLPEIKLWRLGVIKGSHPNNFIHCVLRAVLQGEYLKMSSQEKDNYIRMLRLKLSQPPYFPGLVKQEMYDFSPQEISEMVASFDVYFDPSIFYRYLEEYFHLHIFIFNERDGLVSPRHKYYHLEPFQVTDHREEEYKTLLVFQIKETTVEKQEYPEYDIIIEDKGSTLFDKKMYDYINDIIKNIYSLYTWRFPSLNGQKNWLLSPLFTGMNPQVKPVSQIVDDYGKQRCINFSFDDNKFSLIVPPSSPLNLPLSTEIYHFPMEKFFNLFNYYPSAQDIRNQVNYGLWFSLYDQPYGFYLPIIPVSSEFKGIPNGPPQPFKISNNLEINRIHKLYRDINIIIQLVTWLYQIFWLAKIKEFIPMYEKEIPPFKKEEVSPRPIEEVPSADEEEVLPRPIEESSLVDEEEVSPRPIRESSLVDGKEVSSKYNDDIINEFLQFFTITSHPVQDTSLFYDFTQLKQVLPDISNVKEGISFIHKLSPTLSNGEQIILYSQKMKDKLIYYLRQFSFNYPPYQQYQRIKKIYHLFQYPTDFTSYPENHVFIGNKSLIQWHDHFLQEKEGFYITYYLGIEEIQRRSPFLYHDKDNIIYIIQNVKGNRFSALEVSFQWYLHRVNIGFNRGQDFNQSLESNPPYVLYNINDEGLLIPVESNSTQPIVPFLQIIDYKHERYGAMLPLNIS